MSRNWLRACSLQVSGANVESKDFGGLRVVFECERHHIQTTNFGRFRIYNPAPSTVSAFMAEEYTKIQLYAGYEDNIGLIFSGDIRQSIAGHETAVDTYIDIFAADGDRAYVNTRVTKTLSAGYTPQDKLQVALDAFAQFGVTLGFNMLDLSQPQYPRGLPMIGMARDAIRNVVMSAGGLWSIQNSQIMITNKTLDSNTGTIVLTASSGLIGWPKQTQAGIYVTSLINPNLWPLVKIQLDPSQIIAAEKQLDPGTGIVAPSTQNFELKYQELLAGTYTVFKITTRGDTRGQEWYDESTCIGLGGILPQSQYDQKYTLTAG